MARENSEVFSKAVELDKDENYIPPIHQEEKKSGASKKLFSSLSHADLDKIIKGNGNGSACKKKISQIGSVRNWSPPKTNVKETSSNSFDVIKCLIDDKLVLSDHDYALTQVETLKSSSREKNIPNTSSSTSEQKSKHETKGNSLNDNENDLVGQIIQNMDQIKPDVISQLITAASQDGSSNADSIDQSSKETKKNVFFKASHKYTYKNYKLSNNIVLQKANKSSNQKNLGSLKELRHHQNVTLNKLSSRNSASGVYKTKKRRCIVCGSLHMLSTKDRFCSKCKRSGEEFPLLKQAQKQMLFLNCRSISAPKQRAHLAALEKFNSGDSGTVGTFDERRFPQGPSKSKNHRLKNNFRGKKTTCDKDGTLSSNSGKSYDPGITSIRKITPLNHGKEVHFRTKENKSSYINQKFVRDKSTGGSKKHDQGIPHVSSSRVVGKRLVFNQKCWKKLKSLSKTKGHFIDQVEIKEKQKNSTQNCKKRSNEILLSDSDDSISEDSGNGFDPVKHASDSNVTHLEHESYRKFVRTERDDKRKHESNGTEGNKKLKKISVDNVPEAAGDVNFVSVKEKHESTSTEYIKKSKKIVSVDLSDNVHKAADNISFVQGKSVKKTSSCQKVPKEACINEDNLKREHSMEHKKRYKQSFSNNSEDTFSKRTDSDYHVSSKSSKDKNSYSDHEVEPENSREMIRPSSKKKPMGTAHNWQTLLQKKRRKIKKLASDSEDSDILVSDLDDPNVLASDSDDSLSTVSEGKMDKNILADSENDCRSPELSDPINIITYVVDEDSNVKIMPEFVVHGKQKCSEEEKHLQCFSETYNNSSKESDKCTLSLESCDQPSKSSSMSDQTSDSSSNDDEHYNTIQCDSDETVSKAEGEDCGSSETVCFDVDDSNDSCKSGHSVLGNLDGHEAHVETETSNSCTGNDTDENVVEVPTCVNLNGTSSSQEQLVLENKPTVDHLKDCLESRFSKDKSSEIEVIDLSPCPSPLEKLTAEGEQQFSVSEPYAESAFCADKTKEKNLSSCLGPLEEPVSSSKCKPDISERCIESSSGNTEIDGNDTSSLEYGGRRVILTNINETVPSYPGGTICIKNEKMEIEEAPDSKNEAAVTKTVRYNLHSDAEDFQDQFCYKKISDGLYLMGLADQMDTKNVSRTIASSPSISKRKITDELIPSAAEVEHNSSPTLGKEQEYKFRYRCVGEGITLMYLPDKDTEGESETPVEECLGSTLPEASSVQMIKDSGHDQEVICLSDESCIELSDDDEIQTNNNNNNAAVKIPGGDSIDQIVDASVKVEPPVDVAELGVESVVEQNSSSYHENNGNVSQNESPSVCDVPILQISSVFSIPNWDVEVENHEEMKSNYLTVNDVEAVENETAIMVENGLTETFSSSEEQYNTQDESDSCNRINGFQNEKSTYDETEKTKLEDQDETRKVDVLLKEMNDSAKEGQCFLNAVSELDSVTSANIIDLELGPTDYSSAIIKRKNKIYEELQELLKSKHQVPSQMLQTKINTLRALELLCQKESRESMTRDAQNKNILSCDGQSNELNCKLKTTDSVETQPFSEGEPVVLDSSEVTEDQDPEIIILPPEPSGWGADVISQSDVNKGSTLSMLLSRSVDSCKNTCVSTLTNCNNQNEPSVHGSHVESRHNVPPQQLVNNSIDVSMNCTPVVLPECTTSTSMAQVAEPVQSLLASLLSDPVQPHPPVVLADNACPCPNIMVADSVGQLSATVSRGKTVQPPPAYSVQHYNMPHPLNYQSPMTGVSQAFPSVGTSGGFISQVQSTGESDVTFCVMCPNIATAVCKSCTKVAYCGEACAIKYWNEVHHKVCMKL